MVRDRPLRDLVDRLRGRRPFTLSRWGDDEWHCLFGERNGYLPRDGHFYFNEMQEQLWYTINGGPPYSLSLGTADPRAVEAIVGCSLGRLDWGTDHMSERSDAEALLPSLAAKPLVVVGPPRFRHLKRVLKYAAFVDVPPKNAYLCRDDLVRETMATLEDFKEPVLVSVSAGVCAPLLIDDLFRREGHFHQFVDFGGLWSKLEG